jgi:hypothetical protein
MSETAKGWAHIPIFGDRTVRCRRDRNSDASRLQRPDRRFHTAQAKLQQRLPDFIVSSPAEYLVENVAQRVVNLIVGTARLSNSWDAIEPHEYRWGN